MGVPLDGLVAAYPMNGDASDISGRGHHGMIDAVAPTLNRFCIPDTALFFDGSRSALTVSSHEDFSINATGYLSVSVWLRPEGTALTPDGELLFSRQQGSGYVHWLGKGDRSGTNGNREWSLRIYSADNTEEPPRHNRLSAYLFAYLGGKGPGSHVEEPVASGSWIHLVAQFSKPEHLILLYKNGLHKDTDGFSVNDPYPIPDADLRSGDAPLRMGSQDGHSYFRGAIDDVYFYNRLLDDHEIRGLYLDSSGP
jgi:hypothetical protein